MITRCLSRTIAAGLAAVGAAAFCHFVSDHGIQSFGSSPMRGPIAVDRTARPRGPETEKRL